MGRQRTPIQVNQFIGGLNTEANILAYPANATTDEQNATLLKDGSRRRRLGFDVETGYIANNTGVAIDDSKELGRGQYLWKNPGSDPSKQFMVVQVGNHVAVHDMDNDPLSTTPIYTQTFNSNTYETNYGFAVVDGSLVVATGQEVITVLEYDGSSISSSEKRLLVRDFFGVEAVVGGKNLTDPLNQTSRPSSINDAHLYNLRNQTFGLQRVKHASGSTIVDPVASFYSESGSTVYPSNTDNLTAHLAADPSNSSNRLVERYDPEGHFQNPKGYGYAPKGMFLIDALRRGESRLEREAELSANNPSLSLRVSSLPEDRTTGGPTVITQYAGRVWYSGFQGEVVGGDSRSPDLSSYVLFSQLVESTSQIGNCYQGADPTSHIDPDLVATDGGFIKLDGAYNIQAMLDTKSSLFVFAENGVWQIQGLDRDGFTATGYTVSKIGTEGCIAPSSVVRYEQVIMFWGESAIYVVSQDEVGGYTMQNVTKDTIQSFYDEIPLTGKNFCSGYYDYDSESFRWLYTIDDGDSFDSGELVFNTRFNVFTRNVIPSGSLNTKVLTVTGGQRYSGDTTASVTVSDVLVTVGGQEVFISRDRLFRDTRESFYLVLLGGSSNLVYTFGGFRSESPYDWTELGDETDSPAFLTVGSLTGGDARLLKEIPYVTTYFLRTEDEDFGGVDSSCLLSTRWGWHTDAGTSRWSTPRQAYRPNRIADGTDVVSTKNKIRGRGRAVALHFESEVGKTFRIFGWEHNLDTGTDE